eukprot:m51a1_g4726 hypothetical protein (218) ;mRNA; r:334563-335216
MRPTSLPPLRDHLDAPPGVPRLPRLGPVASAPPQPSRATAVAQAYLKRCAQHGIDFPPLASTTAKAPRGPPTLDALRALAKANAGINFREPPALRETAPRALVPRGRLEPLANASTVARPAVVEYVPVIYGGPHRGEVAELSYQQYYEQQQQQQQQQAQESYAEYSEREYQYQEVVEVDRTDTKARPAKVHNRHDREIVADEFRVKVSVKHSFLFVH